MSFKTQAERWQHLLNGGSLKDTDSEAIVRLKDGYVVDQHELGDWNLYSDTWVEYIEPKPKVVRWMWSDKSGKVGEYMYSDKEISESDYADYFPIKLEWSRQEFES